MAQAVVGEVRAEGLRREQALGLAQPSHPVEELFWGIRRFFETMARRSPLVVVFDDVHWAEATFLELLDQAVATAEAEMDFNTVLLRATANELFAGFSATIACIYAIARTRLASRSIRTPTA